MASTVITRKGQITLPAEIRRQLGLEEGERLDVRVEGDRLIVRRREAVIDQTYGVFHKPGMPALTEDDIRASAQEAAIARDKRSRSGRAARAG